VDGSARAVGATCRLPRLGVRSRSRRSRGVDAANRENPRLLCSRRPPAHSPASKGLIWPQSSRSPGDLFAISTFDISSALGVRIRLSQRGW
jgi:hypothetical protein